MANKPHHTCVVAVDGPAGAGKSSICAEVCHELGWTYVNTGAIYRALGVLAHERNIPGDASTALHALALDFAAKFHWDATKQQLFYGDQDLTPKLHTAEAGIHASMVAKVPELRQALLSAQRKFAHTTAPGCLLDGRDIGTVVFPDADLKIFMTASIQQRATRRYNQLMQLKGNSPSLEELENDIAARDRQDGERGSAPLVQAPDAVVFDTTAMTIPMAITALTDLIRKRCEITSSY